GGVVLRLDEEHARLRRGLPAGLRRLGMGDDDETEAYQCDQQSELGFHRHERAPFGPHSIPDGVGFRLRAFGFGLSAFGSRLSAFGSRLSAFGSRLSDRMTNGLLK